MQIDINCNIASTRRNNSIDVVSKSPVKVRNKVKIKYQDFKTDLEAQHYTVTLIPFEVGSRGQVTKRNRTGPENIFRTNRTA